MYTESKLPLQVIDIIYKITNASTHHSHNNPSIYFGNHMFHLNIRSAVINFA
jgi:hypothetical protein